ncbi:MAG: 7,8-dihydroneopterin aldolase [Candidatus Parcubacteria bacterium]|jgi:dihydroneopterin aldolase
MDTVFVENLEIVGTHGVLDHERKFEQKFLLDIKATFDATNAATTDKLSDTLDYVSFCRIARETIESKPVYLVEKLALTIINRIFEDTRINSVSVTIRKPSVLASGVPGVTMTRSK